MVRGIDYNLFHNNVVFTRGPKGDFFSSAHLELNVFLGSIAEAAIKFRR